MKLRRLSAMRRMSVASAGLMRVRTDRVVVANESSLQPSALSLQLSDLCGRPWPFGFYIRRDAAAGAELAAHHSPHGIAGFHHVFEDLVDDVFLEDAEVAVAEEVFLERFELEAAGARHVADGEVAEVRQASLW